jgi:hypothetical protein
MLTAADVDSLYVNVVVDGELSDNVYESLFAAAGHPICSKNGVDYVEPSK